MSMVTGTDVIFQTPRQGFALAPLLDALLDLWPDALMQNADEEVTRRLTDALGDAGPDVPREVFVYRDQAAGNEWQSVGWTAENGDSMVHVLINEDPARAEMLRITLVIGSVTGETLCLLAAVFDALKRMAGDAGPTRRVDWEADLQAVGYSSGRDRFYQHVEELRDKLYPGWTADELACHPHEAQQFCEVVRRVVAPVPDHLVMKALMNRRRQGKNGMPSILMPGQ